MSQHRMEARLALMASTSRAFADDAADMPALLARIVRQVADQLGETCCLRLLSEDGTWFEDLAIASASPAREALMRAVMGSERQAATEGFSGLVVRDGLPVALPSIDPALARATVKPAYHEVLDRIGLTSGLAVPMRAGGRLLGVLFLVRHLPGGRPYDAADLALLEDLAARAALAIDAACAHGRRDRQLQALFEHSGDATLLTAPDGRILAANPAACQLFGHPAETLCGLGRDGLVDPADPRVAAAVAERERTGAFRGEITMVRADGTRFPAEVVSLVFAEGDQRRTVTTVRDMAARRQAEAALAASEARYRSLLDAMPDPVVIVDHRGRIVLVNAQTEAVLGYARQELTGRPVDLLLAERSRPVHARHMAGYFAAPTARPMGAGRELYVRCKDGCQLPVEVSLSPTGPAEAPMVIATIRDVTERRSAMAQIAERTAELAKAQELATLKEHFLSTISHEVRTPLTLIEGFAELLQDKYQDEPLLEGILDGSRRLGAHFQAILTYNALVGGSLALYKTAVDLGEAVDQAIAIVADRPHAAGARWQVDVPELPPAAADPQRLAQMLAELLDNAAKASPPGGTVVITAEATSTGLRLAVRDDGDGVAVADAERIWQAFGQRPADNTYHPGGLGLGLATVRLLAELHGGQAGLVPGGGRGATFFLELPAAPRACRLSQGGEPSYS